MNFNWTEIRSLNNSQYDGFEALVCQLAEYEPVPNGSKFYRKGKPDGGIECFWKLPDGAEWGWQAKFFLNSPTTVQWGELDKSVKTFLETHPQITHLTIAIPIDLPDARKPRQRSAQQKWEEHITKWQSWANKKGRSIRFDYWGEHQLLDRLSQDKHRGRVFFWFQQESFDQKWFTEKINESIADAGARYTKELDIELPIAQLFDGLGRTDSFYKRVKGFVVDIQKHLPSHQYRAVFPSPIQIALAKLNQAINQICQILSAIDEHSIEILEWETIEKMISQAQIEINTCQKTLEEHGKQIQINTTDNSSYKPEPQEIAKNIEYDLRRLTNNLYELGGLINNEEAKLSNTGAMLLVGDAGKGKTHLFCDVAQHRNNDNLPTILLLGGHFRGDIWHQILELLDLGGQTREIFLGALQAAAQVRGRKALILIDALNESSDLTMWLKRLSSFLQIIRRYKWISIAISVRTSYEDMVIPATLKNEKLIRVEHQGFSGVEYEATRHFFDHYGIEQPSVPLLNPEFETPLFLKILCEGLNNKKLHRIPKGLHGITAIFGFFIDSIFHKLQSPEKMNLSPHNNVVQNAINRLTNSMSDQATHWIPINEAEQIINAETPRVGYTDSLFYHLISEGLVTKDRFRTENDQLAEGISFSYQRLADHLIVKNLLDRYLTDNTADVLNTNTPIKKIILEREQWWRPQTRGLIEAMSIQIPERTGRELIALIDQPSLDWFLASAFIDSVLWRSSQAFNEETLKYVNQCIHHRDLHEKFIDILLTLAVDPEHPYNADFLHRRLIRDEMAERDSWWSIFLANQYGQKGSVDRLIDWAWEQNDKVHIEDESIRLCAVALLWFLTTSHRFVRDRATKALVNLLSDRLHVLHQILQQFRTVNDTYVTERLLAVTYGCCLRSTNNEQIGLIAQDIFDWIFKEGKPPVHILLRDYGRGIVEYAIVRGLKISGDIAKIRPPYSNDWPEIPSKEDIDALEVADGSWDTGGTGWAQNWIIHSVMGWDFARYIIGTNIGHSNWLSLRINEPLWKSANDKKEEFIDSLDEEQKNYWNTYENAHQEHISKIWQARLSIPNELLEKLKTALNESQDEKTGEELLSKIPEIDLQGMAKLQQEEVLAEQNFASRLDKLKLEVFNTLIKPNIEDFSSRESEPWFDLSLAQRWILKRVFTLGWTQKRFGVFDRYHGQDQREAHKVERVGKKYQWIAYHEMLAYLADNFQFREGYSRHKDRQKYNGAWQLNIRDIDPSCVLRSKDENDEVLPQSWWFPFSYKNWNDLKLDIDWIKNIKDLPDIPSLLDVINPNDNSRWFNLRSFYTWQQPTPYDKDRHQLDRRDFWFFIKGYLVHKSDLQEIMSWASQQDFMGNWMPEGRQFHELYLGEFFWAPAYRYYEDPSMGEFGWQTPRRHIPDLSKPLLPLWEEYTASGGTHDCSVDTTFSIHIPTKQLVDDLSLHWHGIDGCYFNNKNELIAFDPSAQSTRPGTLLIHKDSFHEYLERNDYAVLWTLLGEKRIIGGGFNFDDWKGSTTINGVFQYIDGKITGNISAQFSPPTKRGKSK